MLTAYDEPILKQTPVALSSELSPTSEAESRESAAGMRRCCLKRALRIEWLGQTVASVCWIASVLAYGISSTGDWLQICAASAWLLANIASIATAEAG